MFNKNNLVLSCCAIIVAFIWFGFSWSDNNYADQIIAQQNFASPENVFIFIKNSKTPANSTFSVISGQSFTELMDRKNGRLWCDEGAIVLAVLVHRMGYKTRLVDLLDSSGISKHTVLQVLKGSQWTTYDFSKGVSTEDPLVLVDFPAVAKFRDYPNLSHQLLLSNFFVRYLFQFIRPGFYFIWQFSIGSDV